MAGLERQYVAHLLITMLPLQRTSVEYNGATLAVAISPDGSMVARGGEYYVLLESEDIRIPNEGARHRQGQY